MNIIYILITQYLNIIKLFKLKLYIYKMQIAQTLNRISNYLIDWTRVGELLRSGTHRYSFEEIIPRFIICSMTLAPILYYRTINYKVLLQCIIGFIVTHSIIIYPLIIKRYYTMKQCQILITNLQNLYCICKYNTELFSHCNICTQIHLIMHNSAPNSKSSITWGMRLRQLKSLNPQ